MGVLDDVDLGGGAPAQAAPEREVAPTVPAAPSMSRGVLDDVDLGEPGQAAHPPVKAAEPTPSEAEMRPAHAVTARDVRRADPAEPEIGLGDALSQAGENLIPSSKRALVETGKALTVNLPDTVRGIGQIGTGLASKAAGALGVDQKPEEKEHTEALVNALGDYYKGTYGSWKGFKQAVAKDPASVMMDVSTPLSGGLGAGAKLAGTTGKLGRALSVASKAASYADPVSATIGAAGVAARAPNAVAKTLLSKTAGVPKPVLDLANQAGRSTDPAVREAFARHYMGTADAQELLDSAQDAIKAAQAKRSAEYMQSKMGQAAAAKPVNFGNITQYVDDLPKSINRGNAAFQRMPNGTYQMTGVPRNQFTDLNKLSTELRGLVDEYAAAGRNGYMDLDLLKQAVYSAAEKYGLQKDRHVMGLYNQIKDELENVAPGYQKMMEKWQEDGQAIHNITKGLASGQKVDAGRALNAMMRAQKSEHGQDLIRAMAEHDHRLPYMIAGQTLRAGGHGGLRGVLEWVVPFGSAMALAHPGPLGYLAASSPKIVGGSQYALGAAGRAASSPLAQAGKYGAMEMRPAEGESPAGTPEIGDFGKTLTALESGNRNIENTDEGTSSGPAQGYYQITTGTWRDFAPMAGINLREYPNALAAPFGIQTKVASIIPLHRWDKKTLAGLKKAGFDIDPTSTLGENIRANTERPGRATGGRIIDHVGEANKLVRACASGLNDHNDSTEHLMEMPDDAVATALKMADRHI